MFLIYYFSCNIFYVSSIKKNIFNFSYSYYSFNNLCGEYSFIFDIFVNKNFGDVREYFMRSFDKCFNIFSS